MTVGYLDETVPDQVNVLLRKNENRVISAEKSDHIERESCAVGTSDLDAPVQEALDVEGEAGKLEEERDGEVKGGAGM